MLQAQRLIPEPTVRSTMTWTTFLLLPRSAMEETQRVPINMAEKHTEDHMPTTATTVPRDPHPPVRPPVEEVSMPGAKARSHSFPKIRTCPASILWIAPTLRWVLQRVRWLSEGCPVLQAGRQQSCLLTLSGSRYLPQTVMSRFVTVACRNTIKHEQNKHHRREALHPAQQNRFRGRKVWKRCSKKGRNVWKSFPYSTPNLRAHRGRRTR